MSKDVRAYFEETVIPMIAEQFPDVVPEMSIKIGGSFGLGIADEHSDLDADLYLDDELWKARGGQLQLALLHDVPRFAAPTDHAEICVAATSGLLDGQCGAFLEGQGDLPWERVSIESLYFVQENLVLRDAYGLLRRLRDATSPERFPGRLWTKLALQHLGALDDDLSNLRQAAERGKATAAHISLGRVLESMLPLGFVIEKRYYPWRTHLRWAFASLPSLASEVLPHIETIESSPDWRRRIAAIEAVREIYAERAMESGMLTREMLDNLFFAGALEAWSNPNWRDWLTKCERKAGEAGYGSDDAWVWSLWRWADN
jgi:hypothetical protein